MPVIRIAEIPNAGPRAVAASGANISVPQFGGMQVNAQAAQLTGAASLSDASIRRGAQSMLAQTLEQDAFTAEAEAAMVLGKQLGKVGYMAEQMAEQFGKAKDTADLSRAETIMRAAFEKQQTEQLDLPVDKWEENWTRNLEQTRKALSEIKISNNAAAELSPSWDRWSELSSLQIRTQSRKKQIEGFQMDVDANAMMRIADDDLTGAFAIYDRAVKDGIFTPEEGKMRSAKIYDDQIKKAKEQNVDRLTADMNADPEKMLPLFERRSRGEEVPELGDISPVQATSFADKTTSVLRGKLVDADDAADQAVLTGAIRTKEELRQQFPNLPERRLLAHEATMAQVFDASPEGWARVTAARPKIMAAIDLFDPAADDQQLTRFFEIKDRISREMPPGERAEFLDRLNTKYREGNKLPLAMRDAVALIDKLETQEFFGKVNPERLASDREDVRSEEARKLIDIGVKRQQIHDELMKWSKENPVDARDREKVIKQLKILVDPAAVDAANAAVMERVRPAKQPQGNSSYRPEWPMPQEDEPGPVKPAGMSGPLKKQPGVNPNVYTLWDSVTAEFPGVENWGIWGDDAHKKRKSDHNTGDAIDIAVKGHRGDAVAESIISKASSNNVKYVIHNRKIWKPDTGWRPYRGHAHGDHVHVSFNTSRDPMLAAN